MTDFCISAVRYNSSQQHIDFVMVHQDLNTSVGPSRVVPRVFVADLIRMNKATFQTIVKDTNGTWQNGASVHVIDVEYLTTDRNSTKRDNLGNLPTF